MAPPCIYTADMISWRHNDRDGRPNRAVRASEQTPDANLVLAVRRGDKRAFVEIVARHQAMVCGIAFGILGDLAASEDAAQEAFLTAWRKVHDLREPEKLRSWLGQIARNAALGHLRRTRGHENLEEALSLADHAPAPDEVAATEEEAALVRDALARLPESYRVPLVLFYRDGQSVRGVAEALSLSEDAVKQRLARGREMLREQMCGVVESVLTRTAPTAVFTMTIAAAIGALATPAAIASGVFAGASAAATTGSSSALSQWLTAMSTTKASIITAALVAAVCIPIGYRVATGPRAITPSDTSPGPVQASATVKKEPAFKDSAIFAEWRRLHEIHGTTAESMPLIYEAIAAMRDTFRRRAFRAALIAEWVQVDAAGGFEFFLGQRDTSQRNLFFQEWLARDPKAAVDALLASGSAGDQIARGVLAEIARWQPARLVEIIERLPKPSNNFWDTQIRDAYAIVAAAGLDAARKTAEAMTGPNREQVLAGVALAWGKIDANAAIAWAKSLPSEIDRDEIIRAALFGKAAVDPVSALGQIGIVPPGGKQNYFATTTGARVLKEAAKADYDATVAWLAAHAGRLGHDDMMGIAEAVTTRLNADPIAFLDRHAADNSLAAIMPAINSAILNEGGGQRGKIWEWLKTQPETDATKDLRRQVLSSAGYQDPLMAMRLMAELPATPESEAHIQQLASSVFNGGSMIHRFEKLLEQAPERLRQPLIENAFNYLREDSLDDPQTWIARLDLLPEKSRGQATVRLGQAWASQNPESAARWAGSMPAGPLRTDVTANIASSWAAKDPAGAAEWVAKLSEGSERDRSAAMVAWSLVEKNPQEAWNWVQAIQDPSERERAAAQAIQRMAVRNLAQARRLLETAPFSPELKAQIQSSLERLNVLPGADRFP